MNRVDRLMGYLLLFQSRGLMRAQDFADYFEISERTVYRDVQALSEVGVPIVAIPGEGYRLMEGYYLPPISFSADEARAISIAISMLTGFAQDGPTRRAAADALDKIRAVLPSATLRQIEALQSILTFATMTKAPLNLDDRTFLHLQEAIHERRVVNIHYHAMHSNEQSVRDVEPIDLVFVDQTWLLTAYCRLRKGIRNFRLERIDKMRVTPEQFASRGLAGHPPGLGPQRVVVRFDPSVVRWVKEQQHFLFAEVVPNTGDEVMVYQVHEFQQLRHWLLMWGEKVELLEPALFREEMAQTAVSMAAKYQEKQTT